ncbi:MAG: ABC transporter ATP-binding protein [Anaerolineaceae bacterium]|nr:ABC transporter ATP-binding protein [Anaerolineaceae bacterium]
MMNSDTILELNNVFAGYGRILILDGLSFSVRRGQVYGVIGPNGSGKTTMLNAISGLIRTTSGKILLDGKDISRLTMDARCRLGIGRTYQIPRPFIRMSVYENVLAAAIFGTGNSESASKQPALDVLRATGLWEKRDIYSGDLSLLDRKRLEIARAIVAKPRLLLLDEVAAGLTEAETQDVIVLVNKLRHSGFTILWIEHDIDAMLQAADCLMCLAEGRIVKIGDPAEVIASKEVESIYLGSGLEDKLYADN